MGMGSSRPASDKELLCHQDFVRRLARGLVRDAARADDLVQEAWVLALERPPRVATAAIPSSKPPPPPPTDVSARPCGVVCASRP